MRTSKQAIERRLQTLGRSVKPPLQQAQADLFVLEELTDRTQPSLTNSEPEPLSHR